MIFFSLVYLIIRIRYITHVTYKICVDQLFTLSVSRLLVSFWGSQNLHVDFWLPEGVGVPHPLAVQGSTAGPNLT